MSSATTIPTKRPHIRFVSGYLDVVCFFDDRNVGDEHCEEDLNVYTVITLAK